MAQQSIAHCVGCVIAGGHQDSEPRVAIHKHNDELMSAVGGEWTHNVHRESIPWTFGLNSACGLLAVTVVTPSLALWATLGHLYADSTACLVVNSGR